MNKSEKKLATHMTMRGIPLQYYTFDQIREGVVELFCVPRSEIENPARRVSGQE